MSEIISLTSMQWKQKRIEQRLDKMKRTQHKKEKLAERHSNMTKRERKQSIRDIGIAKRAKTEGRRPMIPPMHIITNTIKGSYMGILMQIKHDIETQADDSDSNTFKERLQQLKNEYYTVNESGYSIYDIVGDNFNTKMTNRIKEVENILQ